MYAVTGITGQVGGAVARTLLARDRSIRAVLRDPSKGAGWQAPHNEVFVADMTDAKALTDAFTGAEAVFIVLPPVFDPSPGLSEARSVIEALDEALRAARPPRVVALSTIGAQQSRANLLGQLSLAEERLSALPLPVAFLRPAWFMENARWDLATARREGIVRSFLQPVDRPFPMVATSDVGRVAVGMLEEDWIGRRVVELEGPRRYSPKDLATAFGMALGRSVRADAVPREQWAPFFFAEGMKNPVPRMQMLDGFNEGWIEFERGPSGSMKGHVELHTVVDRLVGRARGSELRTASDAGR
jgi:NAD(P)H dehydrogenase (quinone)